METQQFLGTLNRKAFFSVTYLIIAVAFIFAYFYFWHLHEFDYARNGLSPVSLLDDMLDPIVGVLVILTSIVYGIHFLCGAFYYPYKYRQDIKMDIESAEPESEKEWIDGSNLRGLFIGVVWATIFYFAFCDVFPVSTLLSIIVCWLSLHVVLIFLTSTAGSFKLVTQTLDLTIIMPEEYPEDDEGSHTHVDLYFFIPKFAEESTWREKYIIEYVRSVRVMTIKNNENDKQIKNLSEKLSKIR